MEPADLGRLVAAERARRLLVVGMCFVFYAVLWMAVAARAGRFFEAQCTITVEEHRFGPSCVAMRVTPTGWEPTSLGVDSCGEPPFRVGDTVPCYPFVNDPREVALAPPTIGVATAPRLSLLVLGLASSIAALVVGLGASRRARVDAGGTSEDGPFRVAGRTAGESRPPVTVALRVRAGWAGGIVASAAAVSGVVLTAIAVRHLWTVSGEVPAVLMAALVVGNGALGLALASAWGRSGLIVDAERAVVIRWWGIGRPMWRRHHPLAGITGVRTTIVRRFLRQSEERLELRLDGRVRVLRCADVRQAHRELSALFER